MFGHSQAPPPTMQLLTRLEMHSSLPSSTRLKMLGTVHTLLFQLLSCEKEEDV